VNDLHTADLAWELAERLDADALVNDEIDRNDLDLNRITQIRARAPWFLDTLGEHLEALWRQHHAGTVLFVHGWNVGNPTCDVGLGAPLDCPTRESREPRELEVQPALAIDDAFLAERIGPLREACATRGIATGLGWRYPASSAGNLLQLFTRRYHADPDPRLGRLARLGERINAVQLELGIPLRFPGAWRTRFIDACVDTFGDHPPPTSPTRPADVHELHGASLATRGATLRPTRRVAMQFHRPDGGIAGLIACDLDPKGASGRLLLLPAEGGLYLYTGEAPSAAAPHGVRIGSLGLRSESAGGLELHFEGPLLRFQDTTPFLDLEVGLAGARVCEVSLELRFLRERAEGRDEAPARGTSAWPFDHESTGFGRVSGWVIGLEELRGQRVGHAACTGPSDDPAACDLSGHAFLDGDDSVRGTLALSASLPGAPSGALRIVVPRRGQPVAHRYLAAVRELLTVENVRIEEPRLAGTAPAFGVTLRDTAGRTVEVSGTPGASIPIIRQLPQGRTARYELAFCRYRVDGADAGSGWTEISPRPSEP